MITWTFRQFLPSGVHYWLTDAKHYFSDIDECQNKSRIDCDQLCVNLPGSYFCDCYSGYKLNADGGTCDGKPSNCFNSRPITSSPVQLL